MKLTENFTLSEFLPAGKQPDDVSAGILANLLELCHQVLEPARAALGVPLRITSGWRPPEDNTRVGGVAKSDHEIGCAADVQALKDGALDPPGTRKLFAVCAKMPATGQVILEDHRTALGKPGKMWVHIAIPSSQHGARLAVNRILVSESPGKYREVTAADLLA